MEEIVNGQYKQVEAFREINKQEQSTLFESVCDDFWGTNLNKVGTEHTDHRWPGQNILEQIFRKIWSVREDHHGDPSLFLGICRQPRASYFRHGEFYSEIP